MVFTGVAVPQAAGCATLDQAGPGFTGASLYMDPVSSFKLTKLALPEMQTIGIIHSDDDNAIAFVQEAKQKALSLGITVISEEVGKSDSPVKAAQKMIDQGVQAFGVPIDAYYALRDYEPTSQLLGIAHKNNIPAVCFCHVGFSGAIFYVGAEFKNVGSLSGTQAVKILKEGALPGDLPVLFQEDLTILVDLDASKKLGIEMPLQLLQIAKTVDSERK